MGKLLESIAGLLGFAFVCFVVFKIFVNFWVIFVPIFIFLIYQGAKKPDVSHANVCPICGIGYLKNSHPILSDECYTCISKDENLLNKTLKKVRDNRDKAINAEQHIRNRILKDRILYDQYINSNLWKNKRQYALAHYGVRCEDCGSTYSLQVHHKTYINFGDEDIDDLSVLCRSCHDLKHPYN
jgi:5-methylcytosine-specific restriction endonuclease McrA